MADQAIDDIQKDRSCSLRGHAVLQDPRFNKGTAFSRSERDAFGLNGLLPSGINTLERQAERAYRQYQSYESPLAKNTFMTSLKDQNEVLYYRVIQDHIKEMMPIIYTPTEGDAIARYSHIFRRPEGCFLNIEEAGAIESSLADAATSRGDVRIIVCSDGEQILGIGDQGVGGILISVAKLVLYTVCAGIDPEQTLPVVLDVGTDNEELQNDELYLGLKQPRVRGEEYYAFVDRFIQACRRKFPRAYVHFEDFGLRNARVILDRYSAQIACFNDDVQGTACVTLAAIYSAVHVARYDIKDLRVVMLGAGSAGLGIADQICDAIALESGKPKEEAAVENIWCIDKQGILLQDQSDILSAGQRKYAKSPQDWRNVTTLLDVVKAVKPHVLIGTSTKPGAFTKEVVQAMREGVSRPIIFPLSNPTKLHEAVPKDLYAWTDGKVLTATGSPFDPVEFDGQSHEIAECNNSMAFPGIGLGAILSQTKLLTTKLIVAAVKALSEKAPALRDSNAAILPDVTEASEVSVHIAAAVIREAVNEGLAQANDIPSVKDQQKLQAWVKSSMWKAEYRSLRKA